MRGIHNTAMKIRFSQPIFAAQMSPRVATRHAEAYATSEAFGIEESAGYFRKRLIPIQLPRLLGNRLGVRQESLLE